MHNDEWWYEYRGDRIGPRQGAEMAEAIRAGKIGRTTLVWNAGMVIWKIAADTELGALLGDEEANAVAGTPNGSSPAPETTAIPGGDAVGNPASNAPPNTTHRPNTAIRAWIAVLALSTIAQWYVVFGLRSDATYSSDQMNAFRTATSRHAQDVDELKTAIAEERRMRGEAAAAMNSMGVQKHDSGAFDAAIMCFASATVAAPDEPRYHANLACACYNARDYDRAEAEVDVARRLGYTAKDSWIMDKFTAR